MFAEIEKRIRNYEDRLLVLTEKLEDNTVAKGQVEAVEEEIEELNGKIKDMKKSVKAFQKEFVESYPEIVKKKPAKQQEEYALEARPQGLNILMIAFLIIVGLLLYVVVSSARL